jgi:hypothetical protein
MASIFKNMSILSLAMKCKLRVHTLPFTKKEGLKVSRCQTSNQLEVKVKSICINNKKVVSTNWNQNGGQTNHKQLTHKTQHNPNLGGVHQSFQIQCILCDS